MNIIYEDEMIIGVNKESGISVQPDLRGDVSLSEQLSKYLSLGLEQIHVINRLDRPVGGIVLFAKNKEAAADLSRQTQARSIEKRYMAVAVGRVPEKGSFSHWLVKNQRLNISKAVNEGTNGAKEALLIYSKKDERKDGEDILSLCEIQLLTGRHHQIRVQFSEEGYPLWGDKKYNKNAKYIRGNIKMALFSYKLAFDHPKTKDEIVLHADLPTTYPFKLFL